MWSGIRPKQKEEEKARKERGGEHSKSKTKTQQNGAKLIRKSKQSHKKERCTRKVIKEVRYPPKEATERREVYNPKRKA